MFAMAISGAPRAVLEKARWKFLWKAIENGTLCVSTCARKMSFIQLRWLINGLGRNISRKEQPFKNQNLKSSNSPKVKITVAKRQKNSCTPRVHFSQRRNCSKFANPPPTQLKLSAWLIFHHYHSPPIPPELTWLVGWKSCCTVFAMQSRSLKKDEQKKKIKMA